MEVFASFFPSSLHISHHRAHSTLDHKLGGGDCCGLAQITVFVRAQPHFSPFLFDEVDRPINHILLSHSLTTVSICSVDLAITVTPSGLTGSTPDIQDELRHSTPQQSTPRPSSTVCSIMTTGVSSHPHSGSTPQQSILRTVLLLVGWHRI